MRKNARVTCIDHGTNHTRRATGWKEAGLPIDIKLVNITPITCFEESDSGHIASRQTDGWASASGRCYAVYDIAKSFDGLSCKARPRRESLSLPLGGLTLNLSSRFPGHRQGGMKMNKDVCSTGAAANMDMFVLKYTCIYSAANMAMYVADDRYVQPLEEQISGNE